MIMILEFGNSFYWHGVEFGCRIGGFVYELDGFEHF